MGGAPALLGGAGGGGVFDVEACGSDLIEVQNQNSHIHTRNVVPHLQKLDKHKNMKIYHLQQLAYVVVHVLPLEVKISNLNGVYSMDQSEQLLASTLIMRRILIMMTSLTML